MHVFAEMVTYNIVEFDKQLRMITNRGIPRRVSKGFRKPFLLMGLFSQCLRVQDRYTLIEQLLTSLIEQSYVVHLFLKLQLATQFHL